MQIVPSHTHVSPSGCASLIDLAMLSDANSLQHCETILPLSTSDYLGVSITLTWKSQAPYSSTPHMVWLYDCADFAKACDMITAVDWSLVLSGDIDKAAEEWTKTFLNIMQECIPCRIVQKRRNLPWLTGSVVKYMKKRNKMFQKAKKSGKDAH